MSKLDLKFTSDLNIRQDYLKLSANQKVNPLAGLEPQKWMNIPACI